MRANVFFKSAFVLLGSRNLPVGEVNTPSQSLARVSTFRRLRMSTPQEGSSITGQPARDFGLGLIRKPSPVTRMTVPRTRREMLGQAACSLRLSRDAVDLLLEPRHAPLQRRLAVDLRPVVLRLPPDGSSDMKTLRKGTTVSSFTSREPVNHAGLGQAIAAAAQAHGEPPTGTGALGMSRQRAPDSSSDSNGDGLPGMS
jgi:hypothetical protein